MAFQRWGYEFDGAYTSANNLQSDGGVYVIWDRYADNKWSVLDVGKAIDVRARTMNHDRGQQWKSCAQGEIRFTAAYIRDEATRVAVEKQIRNLVNPPCGDR